MTYIKPNYKKNGDYLVIISITQKFTLIEQLNHTELDKYLLTFRLKKQRILDKKIKNAQVTWIFNAELNFPNP